MRRVLVTYMPAIHAGYLKLIEDQKVDSVYLIGARLGRALLPRLERDIRALNASEVQAMLSVALPGIAVRVAGKNDLEEIPEKSIVIMPKEDISIIIVQRLLPKHKIRYVDSFLRWDKMHSTVKTKPRSSVKVSKALLNKKIIGLAEIEGHKSNDWWRQVGALIVRGGKIMAKAHNYSYPSKNYSIEIFGDPRSNFDAGEKFELSRFIHAEAALVSMAAREGVALKGCDLYITTFPCPVCAKLIANAGIKRIYYRQGYSLLDAEEIFKTSGIKIFKVV